MTHFTEPDLIFLRWQVKFCAFVPPVNAIGRNLYLGGPGEIRRDSKRPYEKDRLARPGRFVGFGGKFSVPLGVSFDDRGVTASDSHC